MTPLIGGKGNDTAYLGAGADTFVWNNGDGSDVVEGQDGTDTMVFNGAPGTDNVTMSANGGRLTFFRVQGNVTMDTHGVEIVDDNPLTGADTVTVNDLTGTDVTQTNVDLAGTLGGTAPDGALDSVDVNATERRRQHQHPEQWLWRRCDRTGHGRLGQARGHDRPPQRPHPRGRGQCGPERRRADSAAGRLAALLPRSWRAPATEPARPAEEPQRAAPGDRPGAGRRPSSSTCESRAKR